MVKTTVTLVSDEIVESDSEAWRLECEARHVLRMSKDDRANALANRERIRGKAEVDKLRAVMRAVYDAAVKRRDNGQA